MPRYKFAVSRSRDLRETGFVRSASFADALDTLSRQIEPEAGSTLEIGVEGFPPARFDCVWSPFMGGLAWQPSELALAA